MHKNMSGAFARRLFLFLATMLIATVGHAEIVIGQVAPLSGVLGSTGQQMALGAKIYFDMTNENGGVNGEKIRHVLVDDAYKTEETVAKTKAMLEKDKPIALIGYAGTANVGELLKQKILEKANIALVAPYTGGEQLRTPFNPWIFHIRAGYVDETSHMVEHVVSLGIKRLAVLFQDDAFGRAGLSGVETASAKLGAQIVAKASYERNTANVDAAIKQISASKPNAVIMVGVNKPVGAFIKGYREAGGEGMLFSISVVEPAELISIAGLNNVRGLAITQPLPFPYSGVSPIIKEFHEAFKKFAPKDAKITYASFEEYIGAKILVEGLKRSTKPLTPDKVIQSLQSLGRYDAGGFTVNFSQDNRIGSRMVNIVVVGAEGRLLK